MNREIPHNIDAEQSVLGSMFLTKKALQKALELLNGSEFYLDNHAKIFECIKDLIDTDCNVVIVDIGETSFYLETVFSLKIRISDIPGF